MTAKSAVMDSRVLEGTQDTKSQEKGRRQVLNTWIFMTCILY